MGNFWRLPAVVVALALYSSIALAQIPGGGGVSQQGAVTTGNCTKWISSGIIADSGGPCGGSGSPGGTSGQVQFNSAGSFGGFTVGGDATLNTSTGALTVTKTNGAAFGALATITPGTGVATLLGGTSSGTGGPAGTTSPTFATGVTFGFITGSTQCLHVSTAGLVSGTGSDCGSGGGGLTVGTSTIAGGTTTRVLFDNAGVLGEYVISGSGNVAMTTGPTFVTPALGTPASGTLTNTTGFPVANLSGTGTGVLIALAINIGSAGAPVVLNGAGGTPSTITLTNGTGLPIAGITGLGTGVATLLGAASSGTGALLGGTAPTMSSATINTALTLGFLTGAGTECMQVSNTGVVSGTGSACGGSGSTGANPTATAGATAVNGSATTFMRSDGAPAVAKGSNSVFGIVEVDNTTIQAAAGVISTVNNGTVTSVSAGCGTSTGGSPITATGAVAAAISSRTNATTSDPIVSTDCGNIVYENSASAVAVNLPVATTSGFGTGTFFNVCNINAGAVTITPTTSTIGGAATLVINAGTASHPNCVPFKSDGTNYSLMDTVTGSGVTAALGIAIGSAGAPVTNGGALGTPSGGTLTNTTGFPLASLSGAGTGVLGAAANNLSAAGGLTSTIASGTAAMGTSAIASGSCATVVTVTATNVATTDTVSFGYNGDPTAVTGYGASATGAVLSIYPYPSAGNVNVKVCNSTAASITPSALTLNWRAWR